VVSACLTTAGFGEVGSEKGETEAREISKSIRTWFPPYCSGSYLWKTTKNGCA